jgi:hypothetical protein
VAEKLNKGVVLYSASVFLEVIPAGTRTPASGELRFPVDTRRERFFHFSVGQMAGQIPNDADFELVQEFNLTRFPLAPDNQLDLHVVLHVQEDKSLYVEVVYTPADSLELLEESIVYGPFLVS